MWRKFGSLERSTVTKYNWVHIGYPKDIKWVFPSSFIHISSLSMTPLLSSIIYLIKVDPRLLFSQIFPLLRVYSPLAKIPPPRWFYYWFYNFRTLSLFIHPPRLLDSWKYLACVIGTRKTSITLYTNSSCRQFIMYEKRSCGLFRI